MGKWAFHSQMFFLGKRLKDHFELSQRKFSVIQDRSLYENAEVFAQNLFNQNFINQRDWQTFQEIYTSALKIITPPDLIIYLKAEVPLLMQRIAKRNREAEKPIASEYIESLNILYNQCIVNFKLCPTLTILLEGTDLRSHEEEQDQIIAKIKQIIESNTNKQPVIKKHLLCLH